MLQTPGITRGSRSEDFHFLVAEKLSFGYVFQCIGLQGRDGDDEFHDKIVHFFGK